MRSFTFIPNHDLPDLATECPQQSVAPVAVYSGQISSTPSSSSPIRHLEEDEEETKHITIRRALIILLKCINRLKWNKI